MGEENIIIECADTREDVLGAAPVFDVKAIDHAVDDLQIFGVSKVRIEAVLPTPEQVEALAPGWAEMSVRDETLIVHLLVSDRLEYSPKALERINRNLLLLLRLGASVIKLHAMFERFVVEQMLATSGEVLSAEAYALAKVWCASHDDLPIKAPAE